VTVRTCASVASASNDGFVPAGETLDLTIPAGVQRNDILVLGVAWRNRLDISVPSTDGFVLPGPWIDSVWLDLSGDNDGVFHTVTQIGSDTTAKYDDGHNPNLWYRRATGTESGTVLSVEFNRPTGFGNPPTNPKRLAAVNAAVCVAVVRGVTWIDTGTTTRRDDLDGAEAETPNFPASISTGRNGVGIGMTSWQGNVGGVLSAPNRTLLEGGEVEEGSDSYFLGWAMFEATITLGTDVAAVDIVNAVEIGTRWGGVGVFLPCVADEADALVLGGLPGRVDTATVLGSDPAGRAVYPEDEWFIWPQPEPTETPQPPIPPWSKPDGGNSPWRTDQSKYD